VGHVGLLLEMLKTEQCLLFLGINIGMVYLFLSTHIKLTG